MANKTIADRIVAAKDTGEEAKFHATDATSSGTEYEFTPEGLASYLQTVDLVAAGTDGLDAGTIQEALQALASRIAALEP